jgi:hypothetical protein
MKIKKNWYYNIVLLLNLIKIIYFNNLMNNKLRCDINQNSAFPGVLGKQDTSLMF